MEEDKEICELQNTQPQRPQISQCALVTEWSNESGYGSQFLGLNSALVVPSEKHFFEWLPKIVFF